jgi:hypothetical protein
MVTKKAVMSINDALDQDVEREVTHLYANITFYDALTHSSTPISLAVYITVPTALVHEVS